MKPKKLCQKLQSPHPNQARIYASGERYEYLGHSDRSRLLFVVTVEKDENEIRIISARKATKSEREQYEERV